MWGLLAAGLLWWGGLALVRGGGSCPSCLDLVGLFFDSGVLDGWRDDKTKRPSRGSRVRLCPWQEVGSLLHVTTCLRLPIQHVVRFASIHIRSTCSTEH